MAEPEHKIPSPHGPEIRPAAFTFDDRGAVIEIEVDGKPVGVLITGVDKLRLANMLAMNMTASELTALRMTVG